MAAAAISTLVVGWGAGMACAQQTILSAAQRPTTIGSSGYFTGQVMVEPIFEASEFRNVSATRVTFQPGARSAWHVHPTGQTLVVVSGTGWTRTEDGEKQVINAAMSSGARRESGTGTVEPIPPS